MLGGEASSATSRVQHAIAGTVSCADITAADARVGRETASVTTTAADAEQLRFTGWCL
jgi:hypothetical protein